MTASSAKADGKPRLSVLFVRNARGHTQISGPETYMLTIIPCLQASGVDVALHCIVNPTLGRPDFLADFEKLGVPVTVSTVGSAAYFSDVSAVIQDARARQANVLHSFDHRSDIVALMAARRLRISVVASFAGWTNWTGQSLKERAYMRADRFALDRADAVLIDSAFVGQQAQIRTGPRPVVVLPNGVDPDRFSGLDGAARKTALFGTPDCFVFSIVGRVHPNKRQLDFVHAAADLAEADPTARFLIVGAAPDGHENYQSEVDSLVISHGLQDKLRQIVVDPDSIPEIMAATDVLLAPCTTESCSFAIIEAMASGKPVVAAHAGGNPELVQDNKTGFLITSESWTDLRDAAKRLLSDEGLRRKMGTAAHARVAETHTVDRMTAATMEIYLATLAHQRAPAIMAQQLADDGYRLLQ